MVSLYSATSPRQGSAAAAGGWSLRVDGLWRDESILVTTWCKEKEGRREREGGGREVEREIGSSQPAWLVTVMTQQVQGQVQVQVQLMVPPLPPPLFPSSPPPQASPNC